MVSYDKLLVFDTLPSIKIYHLQNDDSKIALNKTEVIELGDSLNMLNLVRDWMKETKPIEAFVSGSCILFGSDHDKCMKLLDYKTKKIHTLKDSEICKDLEKKLKIESN